MKNTKKRFAAIFRLKKIVIIVAAAIMLSLFSWMLISYEIQIYDDKSILEWVKKKEMKGEFILKNGTVWLDTDGAPIQAHGGGIIFDEKTSKYYWYGEDKTEPNLPGKTCVPVTGVHCYSSKDLKNWKNEGIALPVFNNPQFADGTEPSDGLPLYIAEDSAVYKNSPLPAFSMKEKDPVPENGTVKSPSATLIKHNDANRIAELNALYEGLTYAQKKEMYLNFNWNKVVERPKVLYNPHTGKYVMRWHHDGDKAGEYAAAEAGAAVSDSPAGPFKYLYTSRLPNTAEGLEQQGMLRDMTLFADDDGKAYLIYSSENNKTTVIMLLDESYTAPAADKYGNSVEGVHWIRAHSDEREAPAVFKNNGAYYMITSGLTGWAPNPAKYHVAKNGIFGEWEDKGNPCAGRKADVTYNAQSTFVLEYRGEDGKTVPGKYILLLDRWSPNNLSQSTYVWLPLTVDAENQTLKLTYHAYLTKEAILGLPSPPLTLKEKIKAFFGI
ncbi:MAG: glycoside hydrolase family 43 protein [Clostridiales bacterium]|jgi:hypothetical protein|nr:glycoside hydrolase family 43 protein [Clostridiales bacterium]